MEGKAAILLAMGIGLLPMMGPLATVSFDLYGAAATGWGFTSGGESIPGPGMSVDEDDSVTMDLFSDDGLPHRFHIDYDGDGVVDSGEPVSPLFTGSTSYTFTADTPGTFTYYCTIHVATMHGTWETVAAPADVHDVAAIGAEGVPAVVEIGQPVTVTVHVENQGTVEETFTVNAYAGTILVGSSSITLAAGNQDAIGFTWDTTGAAAGDYTVSGQAEAVPGETDLDDNTYTDGAVTLVEPPPPPPVPGDLAATLVGRSAWPDHHHHVISKHGPVQTFFARLQNVGPGPVTAKVVFSVYDGAGAFLGMTESAAVTIPLDGLVVVSAGWFVAPGRFAVVAVCMYDTNGDGTFDGVDTGTKTFSFAVVP